jgi:hypothetical protein
LIVGLFKKKEAQVAKPGTVGGFFFYLSVFFAFILSLINIDTLIVILEPSHLQLVVLFASGIFLGNRLATSFIRDHWAVFFHELKHYIPSNLVGNRSKGMKIGRQAGHFQYQYTRSTAKYNALIALAPYWFPLFSIPFLVLPYAIFWPPHHLAHTLVVGVAFGLDLTMNLRDLSDHQSDLQAIRGGYRVGSLYVSSMNTIVATTLIAWAAKDVTGLLDLLRGLWFFTSKLLLNSP